MNLPLADMLEPMRDPLLQGAGAALVSVVFAIALWHKLRDRERFLADLAAYRLLDPRWISPAAWLLIQAEALVVLAVPIPSGRQAGMLLAAALLSLYAIGIAINLLRGRRDIDCGCGGPGQRLSWALVGRNAVLAMLALTWASPPLPRPIEGFDYLAGLAVGLAFVGLYKVVDELIRQAARLAELDTPAAAGEEAR